MTDQIVFNQPVHTDAFVSYRRLDVEFVKQFVDALKAQGKEVWIDWEDLPPGGEEFTEDIRRGIEGSDAFIAILSPGYLESTYCVDLELGYATELHKKIIPVVLEKFDGQPVPPAISHINWIYFTPHAGQENSFEHSVPKVIDAIEVDFNYVRDHTRLLQRALEWEHNNRKKSYLLTGDEIINGEAFLAQSVTKRPGATVEHLEFIQASRHWASQKIRRNLTIAVIVTIFSIFLAGFALVQRQVAVEQRGIAEEQRAIAVDERNRAEEQQQLSDSRRLAVQSLVALDDGQVDLSLLLALEGLISADTLEAIGSLMIIFEENPYLETYLYDHDESLTSVAYHPTDSIAVTGAEDGSLSIWDMETLEVIIALPADDNEIWDIEYHPDGDVFAVARNDGSIEFYSTIDADLVEHIENAHDGIITSLNFDRTGDHFITTSYDSNAKLWDSKTYEPITLKLDDAETTHFDWLLDSVFSPTGEQVAVISWDNILQIWDTETQTPAFDPIQIPSQSSNFSVSVAWSPDGRYILVGDVGGTIHFVDAPSGTMVDFVLSRHVNHIREIVYSPDGTYFATASHDGSIYLWNASNGQPMIEFPLIVHANHVNGLAFSSDGKQMITVGDDGRAVLFDMTRPDLLGETVLTQDSEIYSVIYLSSGDILSMGLEGQVYLTDGETYESEVLFHPEIGRITAASLSPDETILAMATDTGIIQLWDITTLEPLSPSFTAHSATIFALEISPDNTQLASAGDDRIVAIWNIDDLTNNIFEPSKLLEGHTDGIFDVAWLPSQKMIASASRDDTIRLWDLIDDDIYYLLEGHTDDVETIEFVHDGELLISGGRDHNLMVWDIASTLDGEDVIPEVMGNHDDWVLSLAYSPAGDFLVSGGRDRGIIIWDMESLQNYGELLINHDSWVWTVDVADDGLSLVSGGRDGNLVIWNSDVDEWEGLACEIANRSLTEDEWSQYRPATDYEETC